MGIPGRSQIEGWTTSHLDAAASRWRQQAGESDDLFAQHRDQINTPGGTTWEGDAKDAALARVSADVAVVRTQGDLLREAADRAQNAVGDIEAAKRDAMDAIAAAEADGFRVREDLSVADAQPTDVSTLAARQAAAVEHAEDIRWAAQQLVQTDALVGDRLQAKGAELEGIRFDGEGQERDDSIQLLDDEPGAGTDEADEPETEDGGDDTAGAPAEEGPKSPHPDYPNRTRDGKYGQGNSGDGKDAETAALDKREEDTGIELERTQVRATHPDVINPDTNQPQQRYYDALEPTDNPDEYIGIEAKVNEGAHTAKQQRFDDAVTPDRPATATLDGREIRIIDTDVAYPPEGWDAPTADSPPGGAESGASGAAVPPALVGPADGPPAESQPPVPAPTPRPSFPDWGTQLTPQQMIDSGDPALRVAGEEIRRRMAEQGIVDTSGIA